MTPAPQTAPPVASFLLLTEDTGRQSFSTLRVLVQKALRLIDASINVERIELAPLRGEEELLAMGANRWKAHDKFQREQVLLRRRLANDLKMGHFIVFHVDGDCLWSEYLAAKTRGEFSAIQGKDAFEERIRFAVRRLLSDEGDNAQRARARKGVQAQPTSPVDVEECLSRIFLWMPCYSIEAWLYQSIELALKLCKEHHKSRDVPRFESWKTQRSQMEEVRKPKDTICLNDEHNLELAEAFPAEIVEALCCSFHEALAPMRNHAGLAAKLEQARWGA